jgi:dolichol-phosphate mannosyltransferase
MNADPSRTIAKTLVFIPTYNEMENVLPLWNALKKLQLKWDVLFLDDGSPDGTGQILDQLAKDESTITVLHRSGKQGIGSAHQTGIQYAYEHNYTYLITMDADFTHNPEDLPKLLAKAADYDIVVGSRYVLKNSLATWNLLRKLLTWTAHFLTTYLLHLKYDATGALRVYRLDHLPKEIFSLVASKSYSFFFESLHILNLNQFSIGEVPIELPARTYGHSKMNYKEALGSLRFLVLTCFRTYFQRETLLANRSEMMNHEYH